MNPTRTRRNNTESDSASDPESSDSGSESSDDDAGARQTTMPTTGNIRRGRGQICGIVMFFAYFEKPSLFSTTY